jgi:hypothetical protein
MPMAATAHQTGIDGEPRDLANWAELELVKNDLVEFNWPGLECVKYRG